LKINVIFYHYGGKGTDDNIMGHALPERAIRI
jgi:hypothetical protein